MNTTDTIKNEPSHAPEDVRDDALLSIDLAIPCNRCTDCDASCNEVKDVSACHEYDPDLGYCPYITGERIQNPIDF